MIVSADAFAGLNPSAALSAAGELYIAYAPDRYRSEVRVAHVHEGQVEHTVLWTQDDARLDQQVQMHPSLAIDAQGRVLVVHATPQGVALAGLADGTWTSQSLTSEVFERGALSAQLVLDAGGALHVFYRAGEAPVRHVFEGACLEAAAGTEPALTVTRATWRSVHQPAR